MMIHQQHTIIFYHDVFFGGGGTYYTVVFRNIFQAEVKEKKTKWNASAESPSTCPRIGQINEGTILAAPFYKKKTRYWKHDNS